MPGAIYCCLHTCCVYVVLLEVCYVCTPTFIATIANNYGPVIGILKIDCLRLFVVVYKLDVVLLVMYCIYMYIPAFIVTSADISQLWVYLCNLLPEALCCCLLGSQFLMRSKLCVTYVLPIVYLVPSSQCVPDSILFPIFPIVLSMFIVCSLCFPIVPCVPSV